MLMTAVSSSVVLLTTTSACSLLSNPVMSIVIELEVASKLPIFREAFQFRLKSFLLMKVFPTSREEPEPTEIEPVFVKSPPTVSVESFCIERFPLRMKSFAADILLVERVVSENVFSSMFQSAATVEFSTLKEKIPSSPFCASCPRTMEFLAWTSALFFTLKVKSQLAFPAVASWMCPTSSLALSTFRMEPGAWKLRNECMMFVTTALSVMFTNAGPRTLELFGA